MVNCALRALIKNTKIEVLYWKIIKGDKFDFLKVKKLLNSIQTY